MTTPHEAPAALGVPALLERYRAMQETIAEAARAAGRDASELTTVVVTKNHPVDLARALAEHGILDLGENRHQEAQPKAEALGALATPPRWHFVGQLQSNKARAVRRYAHAVHSVDRASVVDALERAGLEEETDARAHPLGVFLQIDLSGQPGRGGAQPEELDALAERILAASTLRLRGLMAVAPLGEQPEAAFARLATLSDRLRTIAPEALELSAGMSQDYAAAIRAGATHLRIGTAITGMRAYPA